MTNIGSDVALMSDGVGVGVQALSNEPLPALLTIPRTAKLLGIGRASAYRYAAAGELPTRRFGSRVYVVTGQLLLMLNGFAA